MDSKKFYECRLGGTLILEAEYDMDSDELYYNVKFDNGEYAERGMTDCEGVVESYITPRMNRIDAFHEALIIMIKVGAWLNNIGQEIHDWNQRETDEEVRDRMIEMQLESKYEEVAS